MKRKSQFDLDSLMQAEPFTYPATPEPARLTPFCRAYIEAALWSTTLPPYATCPCCGCCDVLTHCSDIDEPVCPRCSQRQSNHEPPANENYSLADIAPGCLAQMIADCQKFVEEQNDDWGISELSDEKAGHCFWLSRNGHGSGFFDAVGGQGVLDDACQRLQEAAEAFGSFDLYVGDDGKIYH